MKSISFRSLLTALLLGSFIPLLLLIGMIVYGFQRTYLIEQTKTQLSEFIRSEVETQNHGDLSLLAVQIGEKIRPLGADLFIKDQKGDPVPPALGTGPWLDDKTHQEALSQQRAQFITLHTSSGDRMVFLSPILSKDGQPLGTLESSISLNGIQSQLLALQRWLIGLIGLSVFLVILISQAISSVSLRPIQNLVKVAEQVREGNLKTRAAFYSVHEINQLAETFNQMLDRLGKEIETEKKLNEIMRRFAADASHELRSPLTVFHNSIDLLRKLVDSQNFTTADEVLHVLDREVQLMHQLVENLLLLARLDQAEDDPAKILNMDLIEPFPLIEEVYERAKFLVREQTLVIEYPTREVKPLLADRNMLIHALNNLVENAIHHTPAGKSIFLTVYSEKNNCVFIVRDEGSGIPENQLPFIFDRFYRIDSSRTDRKSGAGLGLAIVQSIVRLHHGRIEVTSAIGEGTTFRVLIPYING